MCLGVSVRVLGASIQSLCTVHRNSGEKKNPLLTNEGQHFLSVSTKQCFVLISSGRGYLSVPDVFQPGCSPTGRPKLMTVRRAKATRRYYLTVVSPYFHMGL